MLLLLSLKLHQNGWYMGAATLVRYDNPVLAADRERERAGRGAKGYAGAPATRIGQGADSLQCSLAATGGCGGYWRLFWRLWRLSEPLLRGAAAV